MTDQQPDLKARMTQAEPVQGSDEEQGTPTPYDAGLREGFRRALEGEVPWWPIPGNPTGEYEQLAPIADPVRVAALQAAVKWLPTRWAADGTLDPSQVLQAAEKFAVWLAGDDPVHQGEAP